MLGTIVFIYASNMPLTGICVGNIQADGVYYDYADPRWIGSPAPRDGCYTFSSETQFSVGQRVSFTANPGEIQSGGTFESASTATDVTAI